MDIIRLNKIAISSVDNPTATDSLQNNDKLIQTKLTYSPYNDICIFQIDPKTLLLTKISPKSKNLKIINKKKFKFPIINIANSNKNNIVSLYFASNKLRLYMVEEDSNQEYHLILRKPFINFKNQKKIIFQTWNESKMALLLQLQDNKIKIIYFSNYNERLKIDKIIKINLVKYNIFERPSTINFTKNKIYILVAAK